MSERIRNIYDMMVTTREFDAVNFLDYKYLPDGELQFAIVRDVITNLEQYLATQVSGEKGQAVEQKSVLILAVKRKLKEYAEAARSLNIGDAGFRRLFLVPEGNGAQKIIASGRAFVEEITKHKPEFKRFGLMDADLAALKNDLDDLQAAAAAKGKAGAKGVGATAGIDDEIMRGMNAEKFLDAMMKIVYRHNAAKLGEWKSARHIRRTSRPAETKTDETNENLPTA